MVQSVIQLLSVLTLFANIFVVYLLVTFLLSKIGILKNLYKLNRNFLEKRNIFYALIVALVATSGSLFLSEVAGFTPCKFCWLQRIFMYPLVLILGVSLFQKARDVEKYVIPMAFIGMLLALYNYYLQISPNPLAPCSSVGFSVSCSERFFTYYGYITIPWMAFSAFLLISYLMLLTYKRK